MALQKNISGQLTQQVLAKGKGGKISSISLVNIHASTTCTVDLYIERELTGKFYLAKGTALPVGATLIFDGVSFDNSTNGFSLFIKLTQGASETPVVDVIIS
tara:strand:+ start:1753 stop:2058 length:306 start_codon:yes stop_codon:yes gene_type:complete